MPLFKAQQLFMDKSVKVKKVISPVGIPFHEFSQETNKQNK